MAEQQVKRFRVLCSGNTEHYEDELEGAREWAAKAIKAGRTSSIMIEDGETGEWKPAESWSDRS